jgi:hypothetical protein
MKQLELIIPGLFPPQDIAADVCAGLHLPALEKLLARGTVDTSQDGDLEGRLCALFGVSSVAPVRAAADGLDVGDAYWLCADPVSLQLQRAQMLVLPESVPVRQDADSLCDTLNAHFVEIGLRFYAPHPQRWYVRMDEEPKVSTTPLRQVLWHDAKFYQPQGIDTLRWQRIATEMQMLLYGHPLNQAREARGEALVNSLWLWGGGRAVPLGQPFEVSGGDSDLAGAFAQMAGVPRIGSIQEMLDVCSGSGLWVCAAAGDALQRGDLHAWREAIQRIEQEVAQPLLKALQAGRLLHLTLDEGTRCYGMFRTDAWKLWRPGRSLAGYAV